MLEWYNKSLMRQCLYLDVYLALSIVILITMACKVQKMVKKIVVYPGIHWGKAGFFQLNAHRLYKRVEIQHRETN